MPLGAQRTTSRAISAGSSATCSGRKRLNIQLHALCSGGSSQHAGSQCWTILTGKVKLGCLRQMHSLKKCCNETDIYLHGHEAVVTQRQVWKRTCAAIAFCCMDSQRLVLCRPHLTSHGLPEVHPGSIRGSRAAHAPSSCVESTVPPASKVYMGASKRLFRMIHFPQCFR